MKKTLFQNVILMVTCLSITSSLVAQSPQGIPYQAVMRNADGSVMASSAVSLTFMIHDGTANGTVVYQESHSLTSNTQGLVSCVVGNGVVSEGNFSSINWGSGAKFLHVMMAGDAVLIDMGTQQMLSVPYALHSSSSDNAANGFSSVSQSGDTLYMNNGNFIIVPGISAANFPPPILGCTDNAACNYNNAATQSDNSCLYQNTTCDDGNVNTMNDVINANCQCAGVLMVSGCTNPQACNYNAAANVDNGSCLIQGAACNDNNANTINDVINPNCQCAGVLMVSGCTNAQACNYNPAANVDNGSCLIQGAACNDNNANTTNDVINGSCVCAGTQTSGSGTGAQLLPGNTTCATQNISVTGCGGQTSLTYDGRTYDLVEIGGQCWFADNLATDQYRNGDPISTGLDNTTWSSTTSGAYAIYNNDIANDAIYGKLYNWYTTVDSRGLCPTGWHVPTDCEWMYLEGALGMSVTDQETYGYRGTNEGGAMKATTNWTSPNTGATNSSGFTALPGGYRYANGPFNVIGNYGYWWSSTEFGSVGAWARRLDYSSSDVNRNIYGNKQSALAFVASGINRLRLFSNL